MYKKIESMNLIKDLGLNIHRFVIPNTEKEFLDILEEFQFCTIRTDHAEKTQDLPFFIWSKSSMTSRINSKVIWEETKNNGYKLIVSDGIKYDKIQNYNMAIKIHKNGGFLCEASELKIPLRHMYRHPLLSISGNIFDRLADWNILNQVYGLDRRSLRDDIWTLYETGLFERWLEVTKYPIEVGIKSQNIVFWQI